MLTSTQVLDILLNNTKHNALYNIAYETDYEKCFKLDGGWGFKFRAILQEVKDNRNSQQFRVMLETWGGEM